MPPVDFITCPTNQPARSRFCFRLFYLVRVSGDNVIDGFFDSASIGNLLHAAAFHQLARITALVPDDFEQILGNLAGNRTFLDQVDHCGKLCRRHRQFLDALASLVECPEQIIDYPVGGQLAVTPLGNSLIIIGDGLFSYQDRGIID